MTQQERKPVMHRTLSRRQFLGTAGIAGVTIATMANGGRVVAQSGGQPAQFQEAPALAEQAAAGQLPPVAERLPQTPLVVQPAEQIGQYGGTWRTALVGGQDTAWLTRTIGYENLVRWDTTWEEVIPNIAEAFEVNPDGKTFTFTLRQGMKWSDGEPFTVDDVMFYAEDIYRNEELTTSLGINPWTAKKVDDLTVAITFEKPYGLFPQYLATPDEASWTRYPRHYLQQFHAKYNTTNLDQLVQEASAADWVELFRQKGANIPGTPYDARWQNPELPTLGPWRVVEPYGEATRMTVERNPFYWKVDPEGNQLPYIDGVNYEILQDSEVLLLKASNGEIDIHSRHITTDANKSVLAGAREAGQFDFFDVIPASMNHVTISLNLTHQDATLREIFNNLDFRIGLSHAINRQEIIDTVYVSQGEPWQCGPRRDMPFFNETLAKQYAEYDVDLANQSLDKVLPNKDGNGMRLKPDGQPFTFIVEVEGSLGTARVDAINLAVQQWAQVGISAQLKPEDRALMYTRKDANQCDCVIWGGDGGLRDAVLDPRWYVPFSAEANYAPGWYIWYAKPSNAQAEPVEPPAAVQESFKVWDQIKAEVDDAKRQELMVQLLAMAQEQFFVIGVNLPGNEYGIVKNNVINVPAQMPGAWFYPNPAPTNPEQYSFTGATQ